MTNVSREIDTVEAAERLACSIVTVARMARNGQLPYLRRNGRGRRAGYVFDANVVEEIARQRLDRYRKAVEALS